MPSQTVRIGLTCNEGCLFCFADPEMWAERPTDSGDDYSNLIGSDWRKSFREVRQAGFDELSISGGEPLLHPDLIRMVRYARLLGFKRVELQTNATLLGNASNARRLAKAGVCSALISLPSHVEKVYNALTATKGYYQAALSGLRNMLDAGVRVSIAHVMCTANFRQLEGFVEFVAERFPEVSGVGFLYVQPEGRATLYPGLYPNLKDLKPHLHRAMAQCDQHGLRFTTDVQCGVPMCMLDGYEDRVDRSLFLEPDSFWAHDLSSYRYMQSHKRKTEACEGCFFSDVCHGFWNEYLDAYGGAGLGAVPGSKRLQQLFPEIAKSPVVEVVNEKHSTSSRMANADGIRPRVLKARGVADDALRPGA